MSARSRATPWFDAPLCARLGDAFAAADRNQRFNANPNRPPGWMGFTTTHLPVDPVAARRDWFYAMAGAHP